MLEPFSLVSFYEWLGDDAVGYMGRHHIVLAARILFFFGSFLSMPNSARCRARFGSPRKAMHAVRAIHPAACDVKAHRTPTSTHVPCRILRGLLTVSVVGALSAILRGHLANLDDVAHYSRPCRVGDDGRVSGSGIPTRRTERKAVLHNRDMCHRLNSVSWHSVHVWL